MFWDTLIGVVAAVALLVLVSFVLTSLVDFYQRFFGKHLKGKLRRPDLIPTYSRFTAVATIAVLVILALLARFSFS